MMFWNRREVYMGFSMEQMGLVRQTLADNDIEYTYRVVNNGMSRTFSAQNPNFICQYYVYVHKKDFEKAQAVLNSGSR